MRWLERWLLPLRPHPLPSRTTMPHMLLSSYRYSAACSGMAGLSELHLHCQPVSLPRT